MDDLKREIEILEEKRDNCTITDAEEKRLTYGPINKRLIRIIRIL